METKYPPSKQFAKLTLQKHILIANDKLFPAELQNWRKIFAGTDEKFLIDGKSIPLKALVEIQIVEYDRNGSSGNKAKNVLSINLSPADIKRIRDEIWRSRTKDLTLFKSIKTHKYKLRSDGKGEVIFFEIKREAKMSDGRNSIYPYQIKIQKGWAVLKEEGVGYTGSSFENERYLAVRLSYEDLIDFFEQIIDGIEIFKITEGCRLRREGMKYEQELIREKYV